MHALDKATLDETFIIRQISDAIMILQNCCHQEQHKQKRRPASSAVVFSTSLLNGKTVTLISVTVQVPMDTMQCRHTVEVGTEVFTRCDSSK